MFLIALLGSLSQRYVLSVGSQFADRWSRWLLHERFGGDKVAFRRTLEFLEPIRDHVLSAAGITAGSVVADVGCGDGLVGFGALPLVGEEGQVIFVDVSEELLARCRDLASALGVGERCRFVHAPAETLQGVADRSVDAVLTRSVLIYVEDKAAAFSAFRRVLRPGGQISLFEPINRRMTVLNRDTLFGYDVTPISDLAERVWEVFKAASPADGPMVGFDDTDLLRLAEHAGFAEIDVTLELSSTDRPPYQGVLWPQLMKIAPNPNAPAYGEAIRQALTSDEASRLEAYLRPLVDQCRGGRFRSAHAYVTAVCPSS